MKPLFEDELFFSLGFQLCGLGFCLVITLTGTITRLGWL